MNQEPEQPITEPVESPVESIDRLDREEILRATFEQVQAPSDPSALLTGLNEEQKAAVQSDSKNLLIYAGAGTGKTNTLIHRIAYIIATQRANPGQILATTFTNRASRELNERIDGLLNAQVKGLWCDTMHSLCSRILRMFAKEAGLDPNFSILDMSRQRRMLIAIMQDLGIARQSKDDQSAINERQIASMISVQKEKRYRANDCELTGDALRIYQAYESDCQLNSLVDFDELLLRCCETLESSYTVRDYVHDRFKYIMIDEYQDTSSIQSHWIDLMTSPEAYLTAVGDEDQSIYAWRGAGIGKIQRLDLRSNRQDIEVISLERNYRSSMNILNMANDLIAVNHDGKQAKRLHSELGDGEKIGYVAAQTSEEEAVIVLDEIQRLKSQGYDLSQIAILYRTAASSLPFENECNSREVPYRQIGAISFYSRQEIQDILSYLQCSVHPNDIQALQRSLSVPRRGIGAKTLEKIQSQAQDMGIEQALLAFANGPSKVAGSMKKYLLLMQKIKAFAKEASSVGQLLDFVLNESKLVDFYRSQGQPEEAITKEENLDQLIAYASTPTYQISSAINPMDVITDYLQHVAMNNSTERMEEDGVNLLTMHAAKGLEFDAVFACSLHDNLLPHIRSQQSLDSIEEERRLLYVAITRARKKLTLSWPATQVFRYGGYKANLPSRFFKEIDKHLPHPVSSSSYLDSDQAYEQPSNFAQETPQIASGLEHLPVGMRLQSRVKHRKFGHGTIMQMKADGEQVIMFINFDSRGTKQMLYKPSLITLIS